MIIIGAILGVVIMLTIMLLIPTGIVATIYFLRKKKFRGALAALLVAVIAFLIVPEGKFYPYLLIDTIRSEKFTQKKFDRIRPGMTKAAVVELIGEQRGDYPSTNPNTLEYCERVTSDGALVVWDFAWLNATVCYDKNNIVTSTNMFWEQD